MRRCAKPDGTNYWRLTEQSCLDRDQAMHDAKWPLMRHADIS